MRVAVWVVVAAVVLATVDGVYGDKAVGAVCSHARDCASELCPSAPAEVHNWTSVEPRCCLPTVSTACGRCNVTGVCYECQRGCLRCELCTSACPVDSIVQCAECSDAFVAVDVDGFTSCAPFVSVYGTFIVVPLSLIATVALYIMGPMRWKQGYDWDEYYPTVAEYLPSKRPWADKAVAATGAGKALFKGGLAFVLSFLGVMDMFSDIVFTVAAYSLGKQGEPVVFILLFAVWAILAVIAGLHTLYQEDLQPCASLCMFLVCAIPLSILGAVMIGSLGTDGEDGVTWGGSAMLTLGLLALSQALFLDPQKAQIMRNRTVVFSAFTFVRNKCCCRKKAKWLKVPPLPVGGRRTGWQDIVVAYRSDETTTIIMHWLEAVMQAAVTLLVAAQNDQQATLSTVTAFSLVLSAVTMGQGARLILFVPTSVFIYATSALLVVSDVMGYFATASLSAWLFILDDTEFPSAHVELNALLGLRAIVPTILTAIALRRLGKGMSEMTEIFAVMGSLIGVIMLLFGLWVPVLASVHFAFTSAVGIPVALCATVLASTKEQQCGVMLDAHRETMLKWLRTPRSRTMVAAFIVLQIVGVLVQDVAVLLTEDLNGTLPRTFAVVHLALFAVGVVTTAAACVHYARSKKLSLRKVLVAGGEPGAAPKRIVVVAADGGAAARRQRRHERRAALAKLAAAAADPATAGDAAVASAGSGSGSGSGGGSGSGNGSGGGSGSGDGSGSGSGSDGEDEARPTSGRATACFKVGDKVDVNLKQVSRGGVVKAVLPGNKYRVEVQQGSTAIVGAGNLWHALCVGDVVLDTIMWRRRKKTVPVTVQTAYGDGSYVIFNHLTNAQSAVFRTNLAYTFVVGDAVAKISYSSRDPEQMAIITGIERGRYEVYLPAEAKVGVLDGGNIRRWPPTAKGNDSGKVEEGDSSKADGGDSSKVEEGDSSKADGGDSSKVEEGDSSKVEEGDSSKAEEGGEQDGSGIRDEVQGAGGTALDDKTGVEGGSAQKDDGGGASGEDDEGVSTEPELHGKPGQAQM